jgi:cysteine desulfurase/selenocysteine lyase
VIKMKEAVLEIADKNKSIIEIRKDFPILSREVNGKPLVYLDNGATTHKPTSVINTLVDYYENYNSNIHRGVHLLSQIATDKYEEAREKVMRFIGAKSLKSIIFTRGTTESINLVATAWGNKNVKAGDEILLTKMEHHSNLIPWQLLAQRTGAILKFIDVDKRGMLVLDDLETLLTEKTKIVSVVHMSNALGTINPVETIIKRARQTGTKVLIDGAQSVPHMAVNVNQMDCDFLAFSSHKMCGPTGVGVLYGKKDILQEMDPYQGGGDMILEVWLDHAKWNSLPNKFEAGTPNIAGVIGLGAAIDYLNNIGMDFIHKHEKELTAYALQKLQGEIDGITIYGPLDPEIRGGMVSFYMNEAHPHDVGTILDQEGIAIRAGHHCCQPLMRHYEISATSRASFYFYNTKEEIDKLVLGLKKVKEIFSNVSRK